MMQPRHPQRRWPRILLVGLIAYVVFYLSGTKAGPVRAPEYSYYLSQRGDYDSGSVGWDPISLWKQTSLAEVVVPAGYQPHEWREREISSQKATGLGAVAGGGYDGPHPMPRTDAGIPLDYGEAGRQVTRTLSLHLLVTDPVQTADRVSALAIALGGYVGSANTGADREGEHGANVSFRVPVARLEEARNALHQMALRVDQERSEATDVTKEFVDRGATLRNYRAEEAQYLTVMKRAVEVKDILEVSAKLSDVRGRIEKLQGELQYLSQQVALATVTVYIDTEAQAQVLGGRWRPWYRIKVAAHDALESLADYFGLMTAFLLRLPAIALWVVTIFGGAAVAWRLFRWLARLWFRGERPGDVKREGV